MSDQVLDRLSLEVKRPDDPFRDWNTVDVLVNGRNLIDMLREVELPFASEEGHPDIAGAYIGLQPKDVFLPARAFLDDPDDWYGEGGKAEILSCDCGEPGCWPFLMRITLGSDRVIWSDFEEPHRSKWNYEDLGPFIFDREEYEAALQGPSGRAVRA